MGRSRWNRGALVLVVGALVISACSSDDDSSTPSTEAAAPTTEEPAPTTEPGLTGEGLELGLLAPPPGLLGSLYVGQERGVGLAVEDVDAGGGVLDGPLVATAYRAELGSESTTTVQTAVGDGAQVLLGPAGSNDAVEVRDEVTSLGSTACSASATVPSITRDQEDLVLFRTAIPDDITTTYLADQIVTRRDESAPGAAWKVAIVARGDDYGQSIGNGLAATLQAAGMEPIVIGYNAQRVIFDSVAAQVVAAAPDLTILVTYAEGANLLSSLVRAGVDPATMVGLDAFFAPRIAEQATASTDVTAVDGFQMLGSMGDRAFLERLYTDDPNGAVANAAQAYDCAVALSLAQALVASGDADTVGQAAIDVTGEGVTCSTYADCLEKQNAGENINYDGVSGQIALDGNGDPTFARFTSAMLEGGVVTNIESSDVDIAEIRRQQEAYAAAAQITKIQQALTFLGFYSGPINGLDTPEFQAALAAFQTSVGLPPTGVFDAATDAALRAALGPYADLVSATTADIQRLMTDLGFYNGPIDGIWTEELSDSIRALQRDLGVPETGVLDAATLRAVYARGGENATTTTTTPDTTVPATTAPPATAPPTTSPTTTPPATTVPPTVPPTTIPPPDPGLPTLREALDEDGRFTGYLQLLEAADLAGLDQIAAYTLFAPTDDALAAAGVDVAVLIENNDPTELFELVANAAMLGRFQLADLADEVEMLSGALFPFVTGPPATINGSEIEQPSIEAFNGVIHPLVTLVLAAG